MAPMMLCRQDSTWKYTQMSRCLRITLKAALARVNSFAISKGWMAAFSTEIRSAILPGKNFNGRFFLIQRTESTKYYGYDDSPDRHRPKLKVQGALT
eukprot:5124390-Pleurochrysis_carterae.AAC.1